MKSLRIYCLCLLCSSLTGCRTQKVSPAQQAEAINPHLEHWVTPDTLSQTNRKLPTTPNNKEKENIQPSWETTGGRNRPPYLGDILFDILRSVMQK